MKQHVYFLFVFLLSTCSSLMAQKTETFTDGNGATVELHTDVMHFADKATGYSRSSHFQRDPSNMLGPPDLLSGTPWPNRKVTSLGCRGSLTAEFVNSAIVDGPGPDLLIFEGGQVFEKTDLSISTDGRKWIKIGVVEGGKAAVDIAHPETKDKVFHFVRLRDKGTMCNHAPNDGADIDAIASISHEEPVELDESIILPVPTVEESLTSNPLEEQATLILDLDEFKIDFTLFPNPTNAELNLKFELEKESEICIQVFDQGGRRLMTLVKKETRSAGSQLISYSLGDLVAGTYYIQLMVGDESVVKKLVKHKK